MSLLAADFFKVGTVLLPAGADQRSLPKWSTILTVAELTILTFTSRACKDFLTLDSTVYLAIKLPLLSLPK